MIHKTSLDRTAIIITICVTALFAAIIVGQYLITGNAEHGNGIYITTALLLVYFAALAFRPINYATTESELIVERLLFNVHIKRSAIKSCEILEGNRIQGSMRMFGVGGLFGYYGSFSNVSIGRMTWYATRRDKVVLIRTLDNRNIIFTPDDLNKFTAALIA